MPYVSTQPAWDLSFDVVVIGSGYAGLTAAYEASAWADSVVVLEKMSYTGGNSRIAGGGYCCWDSKLKLREKLGLGQDSWELHAADTLAAGGGFGDKELVKVMCREAPAGLDLLVDAGITFRNSLPRIGGLHQPDHALDGAVLPNLGRLHLKGAKLVDGTAEHFLPHRLVHREGFPGHHRLVDRGLPGEDDSVDGHTLPRQDAEPVPDLHLLRWKHRLFAVSQHPRRLRRQMHQLFDPGPGPGHRQLLQQAAQLHNKRDLPGGKLLPDADRRDQRQRDQHVRLDIERRDQPDHRLQNNGQPA